MKTKFDSIASALEDIRLGKMVIVCDDEDRENEGDLIMAAEMMTPEAVNFMATHARGLICTPLSASRAQQLSLQKMVHENTSTRETPFTISVDLIIGNSTGISSEDRFRTIKALCDPQSRAEDFMRPGHIFPLVAREGGVLEREGHTEAAVDLTKLAGLQPVGVICEIMNEDGSMARIPQLLELAEKWNLKIITIKDLILYRKKHDHLFIKGPSVKLPCQEGDFQLSYFQSRTNPNEEHLALVHKNFDPQKPALVRLHSECLTGDVFASQRCDCGEQLKRSLQILGQDPQGILLYLRQEGRGIGLKKKLQAYQLQEQGHDTVSANEQLGHGPDERDYHGAAQILRQLGVHQIKLLTNNPQKIKQLEHFGIQILERLPLLPTYHHHNEFYLATKKERMGHLLGDHQ